MVILRQDSPLNYNHHYTSITTHGWDLLSTYVLTRCQLTDLGTEEDYDFEDEAYHEDQVSRKEIRQQECDIEARVSSVLQLPVEQDAISLYNNPALETTNNAASRQQLPANSVAYDNALRATVVDLILDINKARNLL